MELSRKKQITNPAKVKFAGFSISLFTREELISYLKDIVENRNKKVLYGYSLWTISITKEHPAIYEYGEMADILVADGRPYFLMAKWSGLSLGYEISIPNLVFLTLKLANENNWSIFLLGANKTNNELAQKQIEDKYPLIRFVDGTDGYFEENQFPCVISRINKKQHHLLLIGTHSPMKERISVEWKEKLNVNIIIPCGGMIDVLAGKARVAPSFVKKFGAASLYRLIQEPRRLFKRVFRMYLSVFFIFLPLYFYYVVFKKQHDFSLYEYYHKKKKDQP